MLEFVDVSLSLPTTLSLPRLNDSIRRTPPPVPRKKREREREREREKVKREKTINA